MPYGVAKDIGGDNAENDAKMERCVAANTAKGYSKESAIRICKVSIQNAARKHMR